MSDPRQQRTPHEMRLSEWKNLVVALVSRLGGQVALTGEELSMTSEHSFEWRFTLDGGIEIRTQTTRTV